jgi:hypothetical protein
VPLEVLDGRIYIYILYKLNVCKVETIMRNDYDGGNNLELRVMETNERVKVIEKIRDGSEGGSKRI